MKKLIDNKKYLTFILIGLLSIVIGISLSFIYFDLSGNDNTIESGQISMTYIEPSNEIVLKDQLPISDELGKNQDKYFEFTVMSNATTNESDDNGIEIPYEISITPTQISNGYNELENQHIKIYLTKVVGEEEQVVLKPTLVSSLKQSKYKDALKIYDTSNTHSNNEGQITTKYRLRFWIDNNVNATNWYKEDKYEYRFVVNINAEANRNTSKMLAQTIKSLYTKENGTAKEENGYYYLTGMEELDDLTKEQEILSYIGSMASIYYYKNSNGTFDTKQLDKDYHDLLVNIYEEYTEEEYQEEVGMFGGATNFALGMLSGVIEEDPDTYLYKYAEGKTQKDIPTIEEVLKDEDIKLELVEMMSGAISEFAAYFPATFKKIYSDGIKINEKLLNDNLKLSGIAQGHEEIINVANTTFGSISNYIIAESYEYVTYDNNDNPVFIEGKTIEDLPTLDELFLNYEAPTLIRNNYIKLNNLLYKVIGVNSDNSVKLLLSDRIFGIASKVYGIEESDYSKYLGIGEKNEKKSPFINLLKDSTLSDIILKKDYKYLVDNEEKYIKSYISFFTKEEIEKTYSDLKNSFISNEFRYDYSPIANYEKEEATFYEYGKFKKRGNSDYSRYNLNPVITIENIKIEGEGTHNNPYYIKNEEKTSDLNVADSIYKSIKHNLSISSYATRNANYLRPIWNFNNYNYPYYLRSTLEYFEKYNLNMANSNLNYTGNGNLLVGLNINNFCYYNDKYGKIYKSEDQGNCLPKEENELVINASNTQIYLNNEEITLTTEENLEDNTIYSWQYSEDGSEWFTLKEGKNEAKDYFRVRATGVNTKELKVIPIASNYNYMYFRYVINDDVYSDKITINFNNAKINNIIWTPNTNSFYYGDKLTVEADVLGASDIIFGEHKEQAITELGEQHVKMEITIDENFSSGYAAYYINFKGPHAKSTYTQLKFLNIKGPEITKHPSNVEVGVGQTATFNVKAKGTLYYQWQQKIGEEWINLEDIDNKILGSKTDTLQVVSTSEMATETKYRCLLKSKEEVYTNEAKMIIVEADEEWMYEKVLDADGIPTGEVNVVRYIGKYKDSKSVTVNKDYFSQEYFEKIMPNYNASYPEILMSLIVVSPKVFEKVAEVEFGVDIKNITEQQAKNIIDQILYSDKLDTIEWKKYTSGYIDGYEITLPSNYDGLKVIGATKLLFTQLADIKDDYEEYAAECIMYDMCNEVNSYRITDITIPEGYLYLGTDYTEEEFEEKYNGVYNDPDAVIKKIDPLSENAIFYGLVNLENMKLASTIKLLGTYSLAGVSMYNVYTGNYRTLILPKSLEKLSYGAMYYHGMVKISFEEDAVIKELQGGVFSPFTIGLEVPASVETIGTRIVPFNNEESQTTGLSELTFENTAKNPSKLKTIGYQAFYGSMIKELEIPASVETIESLAFASVSRLDIGFNVDKIEKYLEKLTFEDSQDRPSQLKTVAQNAFAYNLPDNVIFPNGIVYGE